MDNPDDTSLANATETQELFLARIVVVFNAKLAVVQICAGSSGGRRRSTDADSLWAVYPGVSKNWEAYAETDASKFAEGQTE